MKKSSFVEGTLIATSAIVFTKILGMLYVIPFYGMLDGLDGGKGTALYGYAYSIYVVFLDISSLFTRIFQLARETPTLPFTVFKYFA